MNEIVYIPVNKIWSHPKNPRQDLGDLTELIASIKQSGILQNLTVVKLVGVSGEWDGESYRVIIGHRRLAAARKAGLEIVPCVVAEMTEREQVAAMLAENMQRASLSYYEEAQGIQTMLDMGAAVSEVASETGFSESTVRRRMTLLKFDGDKVKEGCSRGATLEDYVELDKIKDGEARDKVLSAIGTANFNNLLRRAIGEQEQAERYEYIIERLTEWAYNGSDYPDVSKAFEQTFYPWQDIPEDDLKPREDCGSVRYFYVVPPKSKVVQLWKEISFDGAKDEGEKEESEADKSRRICDEKCERLSEICKRHKELRRDFVKGITEHTAESKRSVIAAYAAMVIYMGRMGYTTCDTLADLLEIERDSNDQIKDTREKIDKYAGNSSWVWQTLLFTVYAALESGAGTPYVRTYNNGEWHVEARVNDSYEVMYDYLVELGYEVSNEEWDIVSGSHELCVSGYET